MQLQVLKAIERVLGPKLPVQSFFDLMVGTGYVDHNHQDVIVFHKLTYFQHWRGDRYRLGSKQMVRQRDHQKVQGDSQGSLYTTRTNKYAPYLGRFRVCYIVVSTKPNRWRRL